MVSAFSGMSKAVDSEAERQAWKATQASISNDDITNVQILLGSKSSMLKDRAVARAKSAYVAEKGNLDGFTHPVLEGKVTTLVGPDGQMELVDKSQKDEYIKQGFTSLDEHATSLLSGGNEGPKGEYHTPKSGKYEGVPHRWNPRKKIYQKI
jgi:hypothetical protein